MTDEELKRLGDRLNWIAARTPDVQARAYKAIEDLRRVTEAVDQHQEAWDEAVGTELVRLEAENAALREIVEAVAGGDVYHDSKGGMLIVDYPSPDALVTKARELLGKSPTTA